MGFLLGFVTLDDLGGEVVAYLVEDFEDERAALLVEESPCGFLGKAAAGDASLVTGDGSGDGLLGREFPGWK